MKILVTGGAGFIGSAFIRYMLQKYDHKIINIDALTYAGHLENLEEIKNHPNYAFVKGDIRDASFIMEIASGIDCVVNFAAESHVDNSINNPAIFVETNVRGTLNLLEAAKIHKIERYLQVSTDEVYGSLGESGYFTENTPIAPNSPYSASKAGADMLVRAYFETYKIPTLITRCSNNYGPFQYPEKLIPFFITKLLNGQKVPVYGDGKNVRDWLYVYDHVKAIERVLHKGKEGEIYNIGGNNEKTNLEITNIILEAMNFDKSMIEHIEDRLGHDRRYAIKSDKIQNELGWSPTVSFEEGIKKTIQWYLDNKNWMDTVLDKNSGKNVNKNFTSKNAAINIKNKEPV